MICSYCFGCNIVHPHLLLTASANRNGTYCKCVCLSLLLCIIQFRNKYVHPKYTYQIWVISATTFIFQRGETFLAWSLISVIIRGLLFSLKQKTIWYITYSSGTTTHEFHSNLSDQCCWTFYAFVFHWRIMGPCPVHIALHCCSLRFVKVTFHHG